MTDGGLGAPRAAPFVRLPPEVVALPGRAILDSIEALGRLLRILRSNGSEIVAWIRRTDDPAVLLSVWNPDRPAVLEAHLDGVERHFFNFLASAHSRVDYYRALRNRGYLVGEFGQEYKQRVASDFGASGLHNWMMCVRNDMLHHRLPSAFGRWSAHVQSSTIDSRVVIDASRLGGQSFNALAKAWMAQRPEIDVLDAVTEYVALLDSFDDWFGRAFARHHLEACEAFLDARARWIRGHLQELGFPAHGPT